MTSASPFGENLRRLSGLYELNVGELAHILGLSRQAVSSLLSGKSQPSTPTLLKVEEIFSVDSRIMTDSFSELLPDQDTYLEVEDRISRLRTERWAKIFRLPDNPRP